MRSVSLEDAEVGRARGAERAGTSTFELLEEEQVGYSYSCVADHARSYSFEGFFNY